MRKPGTHKKYSFEKLSHSAAEQIKCTRWEESILMFSWKCCSTYFYPESKVDIFFSFLFDMAAFCQQQCIQINVSLHLQPYILKAKSLRSLLFSHKISAEKVRKFQHEHFATKVRKLIKSLKLIFAVECSFKYLHICSVMWWKYAAVRNCKRKQTALQITKRDLQKKPAIKSGNRANISFKHGFDLFKDGINLNELNSDYQF